MLSGRRLNIMTQPAESYPKLLSLAVHELRTPASVVVGYLRMIQREGEPPLSERQRMMVEEAEKSCARVVALISELSEIGKLDAGLIGMARQRVDLFSLTQEVAEGVHESEGRGVILEVLGAASGANVTGDRDRLRQALYAIFTAILRETVGPATVVTDRRVVGSAANRSAVLLVTEAARVQKAYDEPRGNFDETRGGMGLALPLARRIIEAHGGQVWSPGADGDRDSSQIGARGAAIISIPLSGASH